MYKVFIDNKELVFVESWLKKSKKRTLVVRFDDFEKTKDILNLRSELAESKRLVVVCEDLDAQFSRTFHKFKKISAAGGVVRRKSSILAIHRLGKWDLPKGKIEKGEDPETAAYREIEEECGISGMHIISRITETYHTYEMNGSKFLKRNYWFYFIYKGDKKLIPQTEEDISVAKWVKINGLKEFESDSYASILEVLKQWRKKFG